MGDYSTEQLWKDCYKIWDERQRARLELVHHRLYRFDRFIENLSWIIIAGLTAFVATVAPALILVLALAFI